MVTQILATPCGSRVYVSGVPTMWAGDDADALRAAYARGEGHYFDPATLRFFGASRFRMVAPGVSIEQQRPDVDRQAFYRVTLWQDVDGIPDSLGGCVHDTLRQAQACARELARVGLVPAGDGAA